MAVHIPEPAAHLSEDVELVCWKVWGGNERTARSVSIPGLKGVLHAQPHKSDEGGDLYFISACGSGAIARLCLADVSGHGAGVARFSAELEQVFSNQIHRENPGAVLQEVNRRSVRDNLELVCTALCLSYNSLDGKLRYASAGHPSARVHSPRDGHWRPLGVSADAVGGLWNIPLGVSGTARYRSEGCSLHPGDLLMVYTDGLTEAFGGSGTSLWAILDAAEPGTTPDELAQRILAELENQYGAGRGAADDITFAVFEVLPYQRTNRYALLVRNNFRRFLRWLGHTG